MKIKILEGTFHRIPDDLLNEINKNEYLINKWNSLTPLARNEWICWVISNKKEETRNNHIQRATKEIVDGKKRPCCWIGCIHRTDKEISKSVQSILSKKK